MDDYHHVSEAPARYKYPTAWKWFYVMGLLGISLLIIAIVLVGVYAINVGDKVRHGQFTQITYGEGEGLFVSAIIALIIGALIGIITFIYVGFNLGTHPHVVHGAANSDVKRALANLRHRFKKQQTTLPDESGVDARDLARNMDEAHKEIRQIETKEVAPPIRETIPATKPIQPKPKQITVSRRVSRKPTSNTVADVQTELRDVGLDLGEICKALKED